MSYLLIVILATTTGGTRALTSEMFSDLRSCQNAGHKIKYWVEDNDSHIGDTTKFKCLEVSGAK